VWAPESRRAFTWFVRVCVRVCVCVCLCVCVGTRADSCAHVQSNMALLVCACGCACADVRACKKVCGCKKVWLPVHLRVSAQRACELWPCPTRELLAIIWIPGDTLTVLGTGFHVLTEHNDQITICNVNKDAGMPAILFCFSRRKCCNRPNVRWPVRWLVRWPAAHQRFFSALKNLRVALLCCSASVSTGCGRLRLGTEL